MFLHVTLNDSFRQAAIDALSCGNLSVLRGARAAGCWQNAGVRQLASEQALLLGTDSPTTFAERLHVAGGERLFAAADRAAAVSVR